MKYVDDKNSGAGLYRVGCSKNSDQIEVSNFTVALLDSMKSKFEGPLIILFLNNPLSLIDHCYFQTIMGF